MSKSLRRLKEQQSIKEILHSKDYLEDDDILFILHKDEIQFLRKELSWFIKAYPRSKYKSQINRLLSLLEE